MPQYSTITATSLPANTPPLPPETACTRCGVLALHHLRAGKGPHAYELRCTSCGAHVQWVSQHTPEERKARREIARGQPMKCRPASIAQRRYLDVLGFAGPVSSMWSAHQAIQGLLQGRVCQ